MKKKILVTILTVMTLSLVACNTSNNDNVDLDTKVETDSEDNTEDDKESEDVLLSFGFSPEEFKENFSNFASFSDIEVTKYDKLASSTWVIQATSPSENTYTLSIMSNSDGKVGSITTGNIDKADFYDIAKAIISATDINFDADEMVKGLGLPETPLAVEDSVLITKYGINVALTPSDFLITRNEETADDYKYIKIQSNSKSKAESLREKEEIAESENNTSDTAANTAPKATLSQSNALRSAKNYLDFTAFSYTGLIEQLEYEGYPTEDATYAVDNCGADWNEQAAKSAQKYLDLMAFSRSELIEQLVYEGFSAEQAEYGVSAVGY